MFKYTRSAISATFDFTKRLIYIFQIGIQTIYIGYVVYRLINNLGNFTGNIILLSISVFYILFQFITTKEFHTKKQLAVKENVKWIVKLTKYAVNIYVITLSVMSLINSTNQNDNGSMLLTILMIMGIVVSAVFDVIIVLIDKQFELIDNALRYDIETFKVNHGVSTTLLKTVIRLDLDKVFPNFDDAAAIKKVKDVNYKQEQKKIRKEDFQKTKK